MKRLRVFDVTEHEERELSLGVQWLKSFVDAHKLADQAVITGFYCRRKKNLYELRKSNSSMQGILNKLRTHFPQHPQALQRAELGARACLKQQSRHVPEHVALSDAQERLALLRVKWGLNPR